MDSGRDQLFSRSDALGGGDMIDILHSLRVCLKYAPSV